MKIPKDGVATGGDGLTRCWWCVGDDLYERYHDTEWGRPRANDQALFEKLCLEGFQSGLSWLTILRKRDNFRRAFRNFEPAVVARFNARSVDRLLKDAGIVRHRGKIESTINNARRCLELIDEFGSVAAYAWSYAPDEKSRPATVTWNWLSQNTTSPESIAMSKDLKKRGWTFVGPPTVYSFMEAVGIVNDHVATCSFQAEVEAERARFRR